MARLISINRGVPESISSKSGKTGIFKKPVDGPVEITRDELVGDAVIDRRHHGGVDQAIYIYFGDDYAWWAQTLGRDMAPGMFGENLTIEGIEGISVAAGDRFAIGPVVLEVTAHRTPCQTLAARMGDPKFVKTYHRAGRPGAYCRVIVPGMIEAPSAVTYTKFAGDRITVAELMALEKLREIPRETLERALAAPVHHKMRDDFSQRLAQLF